MEAIIKSGYKALKSLCYWRVFKIFIASMLLNALILSGLVAGVYLFLDSVSLFGMWDWLVDYGLSFFAAMIAYFMFPIFLPLIISFFDTVIAEAIEKEEYPEVPKPVPPFWPTIMHDVKFTIKALLLNLLMLPFYLLPGVNVFAYYLLNGYLLGTEFFNVIAGRHIDKETAEQIRTKERFHIITIGAFITVGATIPFVNLLCPVWGVALMVHYFHKLKPHYKSTQPRISIEG